ncbi:MAG: hypothetical protein F4Z28_13345 [Gammaproteobacteria bacterium]|nr:hypothetical protein [Gammaproteobacteria bacterium]
MRDAAEWLEANDWCQGVEWADANGREVLEDDAESVARVRMADFAGALKITQGDNRNGNDTGLAKGAVRAWLHLNRYISLEEWNDAPYMTKGEVVRTLRGAALMVEAVEPIPLWPAAIYPERATS